MTERQAPYNAGRYRDALDDLLDRPIAYNPAFKRITNSTVAAIMLSQAWYWSKRHRDDNGWFYKTGKEWEEETGLTRSEQETARKHCNDAGVLDEKLKGVPATMYYRVNKARVYELLGFQFAGFPQTGLQGDPQFAGKQQSGNPANINKESETPPMTPQEEEGSQNIFMLYTQEIGLLTPIIADGIEAWLKDVPEKWLRDAIIEAAKNGARNWKYVEAILKRWHSQGNQEPAKKPRANGHSKAKPKTEFPPVELTEEQLTALRQQAQAAFGGTK